MSLQWPDKKDGCIKMTMSQMFITGGETVLEKLMTDPKAQKTAEEVGKKIESSLEEELKKLT